MFLPKNKLKTTLGILVIATLGSCTTPVKEEVGIKDKPAAKLSKEIKTQTPLTETTSPKLREALKLNGQGINFFGAGKYLQALEVLQKALNIREKVLGKEHPDTALSYNNMAATYYAMDDYPQALLYHQKTLGIREKVLGKEHPSTATSYNNIANVYDAANNYLQAIAYHQKAMIIREKILGKEHPDTVSSYNNIANVYGTTNNYSQAIAYHQKAMTIREKTLGKEHPDTATSYNDIARVYNSMGNYSQALIYHQKALTIRKKVLGTEHPDTAHSYNYISGVYFTTGNYSQTLLYQQKALNIREKVLDREHPDTAISYNNIANAHRDMGNYSQALSYYKKALVIWEKVRGKEHIDIATSYNNISMLFLSMGNYPEALLYAKKALSIRKKMLHRDHGDTANSYNNIGAIYNAMGNYSQALSYYQKALAIRKKGLDEKHSVAESYNNIAGVYNTTGNYSKSLLYNKKALNTLKKVFGERSPKTALSYNNIAMVHYDIGNYSQSLSYHQKALAIREKHDKGHPHTAISYNNIALIHSALGDYPQALSYYQKALNILEKESKDHPFTAKTYYNVSSVYESIENWSQAYEMIVKAYDGYLRTRKTSFAGMGNQQKEHYLKSTNHYVKRLLRISTYYLFDSLTQGNQTKAKQISEKTVNRWLTYKGSIVDSEIRLLTFARSSNNPKVKQAYLQLIELKKRYAKLSQATPEPKQQVEWQQKQKELEQDIASLQYEIAKQDPRFRQADNSHQITAEKLSKFLNPNEVYMDFAWAGDTYYIFTITNDGWSSFNAIGSDSEIINTFVKSFDDNIQNVRQQRQKQGNLHTQSRQTLSKLYELLMTQEVKDSLANKNSLIISPDGPLRQLPFEALYDTQAGQYLIEQKDIRYIASGREFVRVSQQRHQQAENPQAIVFANPNYGGNVAVQNDLGKDVDTVALKSILSRSLPKSLFPAKPLAGTQREATSIKETLNNPTPRTYLGNNASEANLLKVNSPKILHIATHGYFNADSIDPMLQSGLLLAGANTSKKQGKDEGIVSALKLSGLNLKGTDLVVLSACETGKVDPNNTEGISGLTKAFIQAGAKDVIMTLWQVDDNQSASLMETFYQKAKDNTLSYSEALKQSKLSMIDNEQHQHPYYWAGYVLSGL